MAAPSDCSHSRGPGCAALLVLCAVAACQPTVTTGAWTCHEDGSKSDIPDASAPVALDWSTGFENRFCDYEDLAGFCYPDTGGAWKIVTSPFHNGGHAAAFTVTSDDPVDYQSRCVRQGALPEAAYYGAWYYIPKLATNNGNWNLFHYNGGKDWDHIDQLMDVSLINENGGLRVAVYGPNHSAIGAAAPTPPIPIGGWFRIQLYVKQGAAGMAEVALYQDGQRVFDATNVTIGDLTLGQWFVGNWAKGVTPAVSTVYVDDVTISATL